MNYPRRNVILLAMALSFLLSPAATASQPENIEKAIEQLDKWLEKKNEPLERGHARLKEMKEQLASSSEKERGALCRAIGDEYSITQLDSALEYYQRGEHFAMMAADSLTMRECRMKMAAILPINGSVREGFEMLASIDRSSLSPQEKSEYFLARNKMYRYAREFAHQDSLRSHYFHEAAVSADSLIKYIDPSSPRYKLYNAQILASQRQLDMAEAEIREALDMLEPDDPLYGWAAASVGQMVQYRSGKITDESLYYFILGAIGDIRAGKRETTALQVVGNELYNRGDIDRAFTYLNVALDDAIAVGSRIRVIEAAQTLPIITQAFAQKEEAYLQRVKWLVVGLVLAVIIMGVMMWFLWRDHRKRRQLNLRLSKRGADKDVYISQLLGLYSHFMERSEEFSRMAARKIVGGQVQELHRLITSGRLMQEQIQRFHEVFDSTFSGIYPDFVDAVNQLLQPDKQLSLPDPHQFTPEVRILAFMRMGVNDSTNLARFLALSVNTVYTYRNRMKSRAINRDTFEADIMKIGVEDMD